MNQREAFRAMMDFERPDNLCQFGGYWGETIVQMISSITCKNAERYIKIH